MAIPAKLDLVRPLRGGLAKAFADTVRPEEKILSSLEGGMGEALVLTDTRAIMLKAGIMAGVPFGQKALSFPYSDLTAINVGCGGG